MASIRDFSVTKPERQGTSILLKRHSLRCSLCVVIFALEAFLLEAAGLLRSLHLSPTFSRSYVIPTLLVHQLLEVSTSLWLRFFATLRYPSDILLIIGSTPLRL
ncbi:hypothetical protein DL93DRAFT_2085655 [Clavulina sp. PMI_390]|nr:hypothetical protein DL93DRAFT_2085655 [Clavulina sp. PMI_390]